MDPLNLPYSSRFKHIKYEVGDATNPTMDGIKIIVHCCNTVGAWGAGFVVALSRRWRMPEQEYRNWYQRILGEGKNELPLGEVQFVNVEPQIIVANMIGQEGVGFHDGRAPIRYNAIVDGLNKICHYATDYTSKSHYPTIVAPRFGAGLAGGDWNLIAPIIEDELSSKGLQVVIYDLPNRR